MNRILILVTVLLLSLSGPAFAREDDGVPKPNTWMPPEVGEVVPPLGEIHWYQTEEKGRIPNLAELRGDVVIVHTWIWYCDACVRHGVPYVVDLLEANSDRDLRVISLHGHNQRDDVADDHFLGIGRELGMEHSIGVTSYFGEYSPYFNLNVTSTTTYCFVINRSGGLVWRGDPSTKSEEFLEAVQSALSTPAAPPLTYHESPADDPLQDAVGRYMEGRFAAARSAAEKVLSRYGKKKDGAAVVQRAQELVALIDGHEAQLLAGLESAWTARAAGPFFERMQELEEGFRKTDAAKRAKVLAKQAKADAEFTAQLDDWEAWTEVVNGRPALFPVRDDRESQKFAKSLARYLKKNPEGPGAATASKWLERSREARER